MTPPGRLDPRTAALATLAVLLAAAVSLTGQGLLGGTARADVASSPLAGERIEDYADYDGARRCSPRAKPGAKRLLAYLVDTFGGSAGPISRECGGSVSEHTEGRALDWMVDWHDRADRRRVTRFLDRVFATDAAGNTHALARRMGIMYIIWDDRIWRSYQRFEVGPYLSSSCPTKRRCSDTLRHRDHVHVSLSWPGARARTSFYD